MSKQKPYTPPHVTRHDSPADYPDWARGLARSIQEELDVKSGPLCGDGARYITVVDSERRFLQVSDNFCELLGYRRDELIGKRYDEVTAPHTNDIENVYQMFLKLGYMHGLWMLQSRKGTRVLVRYETWLRPDAQIEAHMEIVGAGY